MLTNAGLITGIIFLGIEMHQNNVALDVQARLERESSLRAAMQRRAQNPELIRALAKVRRGEELAEDDAIVLELEGQAVLVDWMLVFRLAEDGVIERSAIPIALWQDFSKDPGFSDAWTKTKHWYPEEFVEFIDSNIISH